MPAPVTRIPPSIPVEPGLLARALELLARVEALPGSSVGALRFGGKGIVLVESGRVCWAAAAGMPQRFSQILRHQHEPPLPREYLQDLLRQAKDGQAPLVQALLATGEISPEGLRAAMFRHVAEAIAHLALFGARWEDFVPHAGYRARFSFSTAEILASIGGRTNPALAGAATTLLEGTLVPETTGWAFLRDAGMGGPVIIAARGEPPLRGEEMLDVSVWAASLFDVTGIFDGAVRIASASWPGDRYVVAWRTGGTYFAARCLNRAGAARLVAGLERQLLPAT
jgi:hypothetical protein